MDAIEILSQTFSQVGEWSDIAISGALLFAPWDTFIGFLERTLLWLITFTGSTGLGIVLFTVGVRLLLLPLTLSSIRSSRKMQELQPMIKELQRRHGKDKQKLQEETVKLYQQHKANPAGSCLPMLLQLPIFIGVYWAVLHLLDPTYHESLSPAVKAILENDSQVKEILSRSFLGLHLGEKPFTSGKVFDFEHFNGVHYLILPVLSIVLQFMQQLMGMPRVQDPQQRMMSKMMLFMPLLFAYITLIFPAGAVLYWVTSSVIGIVQQYLTSGWGSLANYLKFLPPDGKTQPTLASLGIGGSETAAAGAVSVSGGPAGAMTAPKPRSFWDVVGPLVEVMEMVAEPVAEPQSTDPSADRAIEQVRRQGRQMANPRRVRRRR
ncbi:MAG: YidC/Oxa1 family membrane protein insertase [Chloroflexaceae bacterium]|nr:YidC/Oxa1 family membrane protein insertase [Chloroflexaceae bacterium]